MAKAFLEDNKNPKTNEYSYQRFLAHDRCIRFLRSYLQTGEAVIEKRNSPSEIKITDELLQAFEIFDQSEIASELSEASLIKNRRPIRYLLEYMTELGYKRLSDIRPGDTSKAIEKMIEEHYDPSSLTTAISGLRRFYQMFEELRPYRFEIPLGLQRKRSIVEVYSEEEQQKILNYLNSDKISRRDAAICLLSFETGLRGVDIRSLKLTDVDWKYDVINIVQSKTQKPLNLPLRASYGNAMADYLLNERPPSELEYFFLTTRAPFRKLTTIHHIVKKAVEAAGVKTDGRLTGTRMFRHNAASTMLKNKVPLPVIAEELGHSSQDSTMVYLSTDQETMASLTLALPGEK